MDRVVGGKELAHVKNTELLFEDAQKEIVDLVIIAFFLGLGQLFMEDGLDDGLRSCGGELYRAASRR